MSNGIYYYTVCQTIYIIKFMVYNVCQTSFLNNFRGLRWNYAWCHIVVYYMAVYVLSCTLYATP